MFDLLFKASNAPFPFTDPDRNKDFFLNQFIKQIGAQSEEKFKVTSSTGENPVKF